MNFYLPINLYEEDDCVLKHKKELAALGTKAFIVTGRSSAKKNGALSDVLSALESEKTPYVIFDGVEENPSVETVMTARDMGIAEGCDFVIGIGGGSPLDASKAIALMMKNGTKGAEYLYDKNAATDFFPCAAVPTTCGTGSEATPYSILTRHELRTKGSLPHRIFPSLSLTDAKYLAFAPDSVILSTAVDALGHLFESHINSNSSDYSRVVSDGGMKLWKRSLDIFRGRRAAEGDDYKNMMNASSFAGMAISLTGTSIPHGLSYTLTYEKNIPHGKAVGYFLAGYLKEAEREDRNFVLTSTGFKDIDDFEEFFASVWNRENMEKDILRMGINALMENASKLQNCPYKVDRKVLERIAGI